MNRFSEHEIEFFKRLKEHNRPANAEFSIFSVFIIIIVAALVFIPLINLII